MKLNVYFGNEKAGSLESTESRGVIFSYDKKYLQNQITNDIFVFNNDDNWFEELQNSVRN